jgi:hypothetical protein
MRTRLTILSVGVIVAAVGVPQALASGARQAAALPKLIAGPYSGIKPRIVDFSGDAGNIVTGLTWKWTPTQATGHGTSNIQGCVPNCAAGSETPVATVIVLTRPVHGHFTRVIETRRGRRLVGRYPSAWPATAT